MRILAFDPGGTTGVAHTEYFPDSPIPEPSSWQIGPEPHHLVLWEQLHDINPDVLVFEQFVYQIRQSGGSKMPGIVLVSKEYIGVFELYGQMYPADVDIVRQPLNVVGPSAFWNDDKLKKLGLYKTSAPHANDATRHLLFFITFTLKDDRFVRLLK